MSNGETGSKKPHYTQVMKDQISAQEMELVELKRLLDEANKSNGSAVAVEEAAPPTITEPLAVNEHVIVPATTLDCLASITKDVQSVAFVSGMATIVIRRGDRSYTPEIKRVRTGTEMRGPWAACPWIIGDPRDIDRDNELRVRYSQWWQHRLTKQQAMAIWSDDRVEIPKQTVLDPKRFKGFDTGTWSAIGDLDEIEEFVPLREAMRVILMRFNNTFMDWQRRDRNHKFDPRKPNPYKNKLHGVSRNAFVVRAPQPEG